MRILSSLMCVLFLCGVVLAADSTSAKAPAAAPAPAVEKAARAPAAEAPAPAAEPAPAPAPVVETPAPAPVVAPKPAAPSGIQLTWYGMAMLRLREEIITNWLATKDREEKATFSYQIAYKLGLKVKPNDQTLIQFELGNDWYATEEAYGIPGNYYQKRNPLTPWFCLAYAQWDPGYLHLQAGIIPVRGTPLMDLLGVSILLNRTYKMAAHLPWGVVTNFSQTGLRLGAPILKGEKAEDFNIGVDLMSAVLEQRQILAGIDTMKLNPIAVEFLLEVPMTVAGLNLTPQAFIVPNRSYNRSTGKSDLEFGAGFDLGYKVNPDIVLRGGFGYARNSNLNSYKNADGTYNMMYDVIPDPTVSKTDTINSKLDNVGFDRWGTNLNVGTTIALGPGKLDLDFNLSNEQNSCDTTVNDWYPFVDVKYGWALTKNFILMPRVRFFMVAPHVKYDFKETTRPELIFTGVF